MTDKHSPTPWHKEHHTVQDGKGGQKTYQIRAATDKSYRGKLIATLPGWTEEDDANAALMHAAPALLEACEVTEQTLRNLATAFLIGDNAIIAKNEATNLRTTIKQAKGEQAT